MLKDRMKKYRFQTLCVHGSGGLDPLTGAVSVPIYQTSTFAFHTAREGAQIFAGEKDGYFYTRLGNPTQAAFEREISFLEGGEAALATASGMAAITALIVTLSRHGENIISTDTVYGGTHELFHHTLPRMNIEVREVSGLNEDEVEKKIDDKTRLLFIETPANPTMRVIDISMWANIGKKFNIPLVVDNTFATPYLLHGFNYGAEAVIYSTTKYLGGHSDIRTQIQRSLQVRSSECIVNSQ
jgi:methionine-gamma-lyase